MSRGPFDVWAPVPERVRLVGGRRHDRDDPRRRRLVGAGQPVPRGRGRLRLPARRRPGAPARPAVPAPARRRPHGRSRTVDLAAYDWTDDGWPGGSSPGSVVYELHVGTFTPEGTLDAAAGRLDHLLDLGVGFVELMPVNSFDGTHNWGYDGVGWFAVDETYGGPAAYQRFVDACHRAGLGVIQDVVYNHLGPSGNYLPLFGPYLKTGPQHLGRPGQPGRRGLGRGAALHPRQRPDVARGLPRRRAAARRRARAPGLLAGAPAGGDGHRGRGAVGPARPAADPDRRVRPQRPDARHAARGRRPRARRPVERRLPPRPARRAHRRDARLLRRLRAARRAGQGLRARLLPRRHVVVVPRARARRPDRPRRRAALAPGRLQPEPRPGRQPGRRRPPHRRARRRPAGVRGPGDAVLAVHPDALPGRGVGGLDAVPVLHLAHRSRDRPGDLRGPAHRVRPARLGPRGRARPAGRGDVPPLEARLGRASLTARRADAVGLPAAGRAAARAPRPDRAGVRRVHGGRGDAGVHDAPRRADGRRELRRAGADRRRSTPPGCSSRPSRASTSPTARSPSRRTPAAWSLSSCRTPGPRG